MLTRLCLLGGACGKPHGYLGDRGGYTVDDKASSIDSNLNIVGSFAIIIDLYHVASLY